MNQHQITGRIKEAAGEVQEQAGKLVGSKQQQAEGHAREQAGKLEKSVADRTEELKDVLRESGRH